MQPQTKLHSPIFQHATESSTRRSAPVWHGLGKEDAALAAVEIQMRLVGDVAQAYWPVHFSEAAYYVAGRGYDQYRPAYELGWVAALQHPDADYADMEKHLALQWEGRSAESLLPWREVRPAVVDAWKHARWELQRLQEMRPRPVHPVNAQELLRPLYAACLALEQEFAHMAQLPMDDFARQVLQKHRQLMEAMAMELRPYAVSGLAMLPPSSRWPKRLLKQWFKVKTAFAEWQAAEVFERCEQREHSLLKNYEQALRQPVAEEVLELLQRQTKLLRVHQDKLRWVRQNWPL